MRNIERMLLLPVDGHGVDERDVFTGADWDPLHPADALCHGEVVEVSLSDESVTETTSNFHLLFLR